MEKLSKLKYLYFLTTLGFLALRPGAAFHWSDLPFVLFFIILLYALFYDLRAVPIPEKQTVWVEYAYFAFLVWTGYRFHPGLFMVFALAPILQVGSLPRPKRPWPAFSLFFMFFLSLSAVLFYFADPGQEFGHRFLAQIAGLIVLFYISYQWISIRKSDTHSLSKMQEQLKEKNDILSTLAHELRTPLTIIKSSNDILLDECGQKMTPDQIRFLNIISNHVHRLIDLVEEILVNVKLEHVWFKSNFKPVDLNILIKDIIVFMQPFLKQKNQDLQYRHPKMVHKAVADKKWIKQVMINLIHNASKYTGERGAILISLNENEQYILVSVSDNGRGIDDERKKALLNEAESFIDKFSLSREGFGLGLAIVKHIIEKHQGKVYISSVEGLGTTFSFTLPKKKETL